MKVMFPILNLAILFGWRVESDISFDKEFIKQIAGQLEDLKRRGK